MNKYNIFWVIEPYPQGNKKPDKLILIRSWVFAQQAPSLALLLHPIGDFLRVIQ